MVCGCSKLLNHGLFLSLFKFFWGNYILNLIENSGLKSKMLYCLIFEVLLDVQANLPEIEVKNKILELYV